MTISAFRKWFKVHRSRGTALSSDFPTATWTLEIIGRGTWDWDWEEDEEGTAWKGIRKMGAWWGCKGFKSSIGAVQELNYWMGKQQWVGRIRKNGNCNIGWIGMQIETHWKLDFLIDSLPMACGNWRFSHFVFHCSENWKLKSNTTQ